MGLSQYLLNRPNSNSIPIGGSCEKVFETNSELYKLLLMEMVMLIPRINCKLETSIVHESIKT